MNDFLLLATVAALRGQIAALRDQWLDAAKEAAGDDQVLNHEALENVLEMRSELIREIRKRQEVLLALTDSVTGEAGG